MKIWQILRYMYLLSILVTLVINLLSGNHYVAVLMFYHTMAFVIIVWSYDLVYQSVFQDWADVKRLAEKRDAERVREQAFYRKCVDGDK